MKKVVSYSLFGTAAPKYAQYLPAIVRAHLALFPPDEGWVMRLHYDPPRLGSYWDVLLRLAAKGRVELVPMMETPPLCKGMLWRLAPLFYDDVGVVFCRDLDSLPTPRDRACCDEFLKSNADVHVIHDNPMHDGMMGGLSGFKAGVGTSLYALGVKTFDDLCTQGAEAAMQALRMPLDWNKKGADQDVLNHFIAPKFKVLVHRAQGRLFKGFFTNIANVDWRGIPQLGVGPLKPGELLRAEALSPFMGSAGFDVTAAVKFYDELSEPLVLDDVDDAEAGRE